MDNDYWKNYFEAAAKLKDPQAQVARTLNKVPMGDAEFNELLNDIQEKLNIQKDDVVLDLCCGNGLITSHLAWKCKSVVAVDFSQTLINEINKRDKHDNIVGVVDDITKVTFKEATFDKIILYAGIQYLTHRQAAVLFNSLYAWLKDGGIIYIGDIPDSDRIWNFFNTLEREGVYFKGVLEDAPLIGTWFSKSFLEKLAIYCKFSECKILDQPKEFFNSHYRFDMVCKK